MAAELHNGQSAPAANAGSRRLRVIVAKPGLDGHDRGAKVIARALRDAGMEVIYMGVHQTPELIAESALQEDADVIAVSLLSGAHMPLVAELLNELHARGVYELPVLVGGTIPSRDAEKLIELGVAGVRGPGTTRDELVRVVREAAEGRQP